MSHSDDHSTAIVPASPRDLAAVTSAEDVPGEDPLIGTTLHDTYTVVRFLAEGGMGRVYEAQHTRITTKRFAIKVLHADLKHSMDVRLRFRREAEAAASIDHPNILGVHDFGYSPDGRPYLVSDYLEGRELAALVDKGEPLSIPLAISIARQLCRALEAAHDRGVIHRDLKPANVFLVGPLHDPDVRVLDFGLSKIVELADASVTQTGTIMGTPSYMSPEQAKGERADHRVDIYGVGAVLYACLTGKPPFEEESPHQTVLAVITREPERPCVLVPSIPPALEVVVQKAMSRDPEHRYATMKDLELALWPFSDEATAQNSGPTSRTGARPALASDPARKSRAISDTSEAVGVRRRAVGWLVLAGCLSFFGALSAALGTFETLSRSHKLSPSELVLISLAVVGSLFTPGVLFVLWLRRRYWSNSARMVDLVAAVRGPVLAGASVYGVAALLGRLLDTTSRYLPAPAPAPNASGWLGWAPVLFGVGILSAVGAILRGRILGRSTSLVRRFFGGPLLFAAILGASGVLLVAGYRMSQRAANGQHASPSGGTDRPVLTPIAEASAPPLTVASASSSAPQSSAAPTKRSETPAAPPAELTTAIAGGVDALTALQVRYPNDPEVQKRLALALGKEPGRASEVLRVLDTLFDEEPGQAEDPNLASLVRDVALSSSASTSQRAVDLMQSRMGLRGAEMLFDLMLKQPELRQRAGAALESSDVQRNLSPALKIAYDLHTAPSCAAREALLPQAERDGDDRSIAVLNMFTAKTLRGCGPKKNKPCPAACAKETPAFEQAMLLIKQRLSVPKPVQ